jgi:hypothetical protein
MIKSLAKQYAEANRELIESSDAEKDKYLKAKIKVIQEMVNESSKRITEQTTDMVNS